MAASKAEEALLQALDGKADMARQVLLTNEESPLRVWELGRLPLQAEVG